MIKRVDHIGIAVPNLEMMIPLFRDVFGLISDQPVELPEQEVVVQFWHAGDTAIELLAPLTETSQIQRFLDRRGQGLNHICFEVENIQKELDRYAQMQMELVDSVAWKSPHGLAAYIHPKSANGISIELRQYE